MHEESATTNTHTQKRGFDLEGIDGEDTDSTRTPKVTDEQFLAQQKERASIFSKNVVDTSADWFSQLTQEKDPNESFDPSPLLHSPHNIRQILRSCERYSKRR